MSLPLSDNMEQILDRFDEAWNGGTPPRIEDYLAAGNPAQQRALLLELVRIDLERRLAAGEQVRLEEAYLRRFPELSADASAVVTLAKHEYDMRRRNEPELMLGEYLKRFPQCQTELLAHLPTLGDSRCGQEQGGAAFTLAASAATELDLRDYELMERLGGGGMGDVYRAGDPALGRDLAVKVMKADLQGHAAAEQRFLREARVTGSLQHPGIVPIYNLGRLSDGRLHYTMRLVRGRTLADILREEAGRLERLGALLTVFEKICQAVAYAHSKQVIHRDLKPANVMVGRFGEVQVMDWGLAKLLTAADGSAAAEGTVEREGTRIYTEGVDTPLAETRMGREMGTPAYMPPEQALGEWDMVDERADVFALGSILCEILTGQPAYIGTESCEVFRRAKRGDIAETLERLHQCGAEAALTALCGECLSPNPKDRPRDAAVVADRVAAHQAQVQERLQQAEVERAQAQARAREERSRRRWVIAFLLVLLAGVAVSFWQAVRATLAEGRAIAERDDKEIALGKAEAAAEAERQAKEAEAAQRRQAMDSEEKMKAVLAFFQDKVLAAGRPQGQEGGQGKDVTLRKAIDAAEPEIAKAFADRPLVEASIRETLGETYYYLGEYPQAIQQFQRALALRESKLGPDHPETLISSNSLATAYLSAGRQECIPLLEQTLKHQEAKLGPDHPATLKSRQNLAAAYLTLADRTADAIRLLEQTLKQYEAKLGTENPDTFGPRHELARAYHRAGRMANAIALFEQNLKYAEAQLGPDHLQTLIYRQNLAAAYSSAGRAAEAIRLSEQILKQREVKLGADHPHTIFSRGHLANAYLAAGRMDEAVRLYEQTLKQSEAKLGSDHPDTLTAMANLGSAYRESGRVKEAISLLDTALQRGRKHSSGLHTTIAQLPAHLGQAYERDGQIVKAESLYRGFLEECQRKFGPNDPRTANALLQLGNNLLKQKKPAEAEPLLRQGLTIREHKQPDLWNTFNARSILGEALLGQKKYAEAETLLVRGYQGMKQRQDKIPPVYRQARLSEALERLVQLYEATDQKEKAADWRKQLQETTAPEKITKP